MTDPVLLPDGPPLGSRTIMTQWWRDATFLHWPVAPADVAHLFPHGARPDEHGGTTWVGLIAFKLGDGAIGTGPAVPWWGTFWETNVRLYSVDDRGRHGVVFRSLETERLAAVVGARLAFGIPYVWASMQGGRRRGPSGERLMHYASRRVTPARPSLLLDLEVGDVVQEPTSLEHFLTARFGLHTRHAGSTWWIPNTHTAWPLRRASVRTLADDLVAAAGVPGVAGAAPSSVLFSEGVRSTFGVPQRL